LAAEQTALLKPMAGNLYQILPGLFPYAVPAFFSLLVAIAWVIVFAKLKHIEALVLERSPVRSAGEHKKERVRPERDDRIFHIRASSIQRDAKRHTLAINRPRHASLTPQENARLLSLRPGGAKSSRDALGSQVSKQHSAQ
jgi:hypothetical protein